MQDKVTWCHATSNSLPKPGRWVVVFNPKDAHEQPEPFPAVLVEAKHGYLWHDLSASEGDIQYAPVNSYSMWAYIAPPSHR
ncbi:MAG: hypothetical protein UMU75_03020 [Halomonas sp.]|nr:hypothetical protein [Halomonas sp.]